MKAPVTRTGRTTNALLVYLIIVVSFQVFLVTVAVEGFSEGDEVLAWSAAAVSVALAAVAVFFGRALRR